MKDSALENVKREIHYTKKLFETRLVIRIIRCLRTADKDLLFVHSFKNVRYSD